VATSLVFLHVFPSIDTKCVVIQAVHGVNHTGGPGATVLICGKAAVFLDVVEQRSGILPEGSLACTAGRKTTGFGTESNELLC
jgi:hypothetical protein